MLQRRAFLQGRPIRGAGVRDIVWLTPTGVEMSDSDWNNGMSRCLGVRLNGEMLDEVEFGSSLHPVEQTVGDLAIRVPPGQIDQDQHLAVGESLEGGNVVLVGALAGLPDASQGDGRVQQGLAAAYSIKGVD